MPSRTVAILAAAAVIIAALVITVVLVTGSGSSVSNDGQYTARANAICRIAGSTTLPVIKRLTTAAESLMSSGGEKSSPQVTGELRQLYVTARQTLTKLRAVKEPIADRGSIEQFLTPFAVVTKALGQAATAAGAGQPQKALLEVEAVASDSQQMTSAAKSLGLTACQNALAAVP